MGRGGFHAAHPLESLARALERGAGGVNIRERGELRVRGRAEDDDQRPAAREHRAEAGREPRAALHAGLAREPRGLVAGPLRALAREGGRAFEPRARVPGAQYAALERGCDIGRGGRSPASVEQVCQRISPGAFLYNDTRAAMSGGTKAVTRAPSFSHLAQPGPKLTRAAAPSSAAKRLIVRPFATVSSVSGPEGRALVAGPGVHAAPRARSRATYSPARSRRRDSRSARSTLGGSSTFPAARPLPVKTNSQPRRSIRYARPASAPPRGRPRGSRGSAGARARRPRPSARRPRRRRPPQGRPSRIRPPRAPSRASREREARARMSAAWPGRL